MSDETISNLQQLLSSYLGPNKNIVKTHMTRLTAPGENFGSVMLRLDVTLRLNDGSEEMLYAVAKLLPESELFRQIFNIQVTFKNEVAFYKTILPTLREFQLEHGVTDVLDNFADFYGARFSLDENSDVVDNEAVLVLENLVVAGYRNINRVEEFSLDEAKLLLKELANFHGVAIALKLKKPEEFEKKIKTTCQDYIPHQGFPEVCKKAVQQMLTDKGGFNDIIPKVTLWGEKPIPRAREPFGTLTHCDMWVNNTMQKFVDGKVVKNKFVDFQVYSYRSVVSDLFFFLWTSVKQSVLELHLDNLIKYYHEHLLETLRVYGCSTDAFSYDNLLEEIKIESPFEFGHSVEFAIFVVHGKKGGSQVKEVPTPEKLVENCSDIAKEKLYYMVRECHKRGWM